MGNTKKCLEYKKWRSLIKRVVGRNITVLSKPKLYDVGLYYGEIVNFSEISNGIDEIYDVCNQLDDETGTDKKHRKSNRRLFNDDERRIIVSRNS